jgi:hypothetical protein
VSGRYPTVAPEAPESESVSRLLAGFKEHRAMTSQNVNPRDGKIVNTLEETTDSEAEMRDSEQIESMTGECRELVRKQAA